MVKKIVEKFIIGSFLMLGIFLLGEKQVYGSDVQIDNNVHVRMAFLEINPTQLEAFTIAVKEEMKASLEVEPGVLALYSIADRENPNKLTFIEIYKNEEAYQFHRDTPHFQKYFNTTKDMITSRILTVGVPVELLDKYNTPLKK